jgi:hypothetical protein
MATREQLEANEYWQCTVERMNFPTESRARFDCLMRSHNGGFYWHTPEYDGYYPWGATRDYLPRFTALAVADGTLRVASGTVPT